MCNSIQYNAKLLLCLQVINETCIEISSVDPSIICFADLQDRVKQITLHGKGFNNQLDQDKALCRFMTADNQLLSEYINSSLRNYRYMSCLLSVGAVTST